ncbi:4-hydroxythreonine-4-phosphate dehydrogenase PdxA [Tautonia marina]|uniref:4-hydroxythreonine-4-phosphate dehydrogenase PdxA n=1 Tax=Tautonia marina TaxID=2653855 RepID=UPI001F2835F2|nr:4-hydroxythreonine-4-phosphate dehydrogenase PdxA [Tautonia marina]
MRNAEELTLADDRPLVALTMGDVAGVGPEVIARAWPDSPLRDLARPVVIGCAEALQRAVGSCGLDLEVRRVDRPEAAEPSDRVIPCLEVPGVDVLDVPLGKVDARAGRAAYEFLITAIDLALAGRVDAITTMPLNKESLHAGGVPYPGHTEVLADRCRVPRHAMMLYLPPRDGSSGGLGVIHVTLHVPLSKVFDLLTVDRVFETILLASDSMQPLLDGRAPRVAVAGLNPHAGEHGLFGDEEIRIIAPAVARALAEGVAVEGPIAADTLFARALDGEFDAVVAMYHDQGHVALKTIGFDRAVNITLGLPIVRTSVAHGTAFDIAGMGIVRTDSLIAAVRVAAQLARPRLSVG